MSASGLDIAAVRRAFDERFAEPLAERAEAMTTLILIELAQEPFALRLSELAGFEPLRKCVALAGAAAGVIGVAGVRGRILPVFDLAQALGLNESASCRWLALHGGAASAVALGFAEFRGQLQVPASAVQRAADSVARRHAPDLVSIGQRPVAVISLGSLAAVLHERTRAAATSSSFP